MNNNFHCFAFIITIRASVHRKTNIVVHSLPDNIMMLNGRQTESKPTHTHNKA